jgi:hypothetical protein
MRIIKDPFTGKLLVSLDAFEMKNAREKSVFEITYANLKVFFDDIYNIINTEIDKIEKEKEKKRNEELFNK